MKDKIIKGWAIVDKKYDYIHTYWEDTGRRAIYCSKEAAEKAREKHATLMCKSISKVIPCEIHLKSKAK